MLPTTDYGAGDVDYGTLAQKMMANIFAGNGLGEEEVANGEDREMRSPESPSPMKRDLASLRGESPISPSPLSRVEEADPEEELVEEDDESEGGDRTARDQAP